MTASMPPTPRGLRAALAVIGAVATAAGASGVVRGAREVADAGAFSPNVDSEYRFYAAWYHIVGLALITSSRRRVVPATAVHGCSLGFFLAASGRLLSVRRVGTPHWSRTALMIIEFAIAALLPAWYASAARRANAGGLLHREA